MPSLRCVALLILAATLSGVAAAEGARASLPKDMAPPKRLSTEAVNRFKTERAATVGRRSECNLRQFRGKDGEIVITNRPERYQNRREYVEVQLHFEPVIVAPQFKAFTSVAQYTPATFTDLVKYYSGVYRLDQNLVYAVIRAESNFNAYAVSKAGARGLMQLMPGTAAEMGVTDIFDPAQNIAGGTQYLSRMMGLFNNDTKLAVAAYNAGPNAVKKHNGIPPFAETQQYVNDVLRFHAQYSGKQLAPQYVVVAKAKPKAEDLPKDAKKKGGYLIHFVSGYTQPADRIVDEDPYYYVQYGNRTALVRKERVAKIVEAA